MTGEQEKPATEEQEKQEQASQMGEPERELEKELREDPDDLDKKTDVGSDESMDASDPLAVVQPGHDDDPVPSSGFPE